MQAARGDEGGSAQAADDGKTCWRPPNASSPSTKEWFSTARNYALYSNQGGIYDDVLKFMKLG